MDKRITGESDPLVRWAQQLMKYYEAALDSQVDRLEMSVGQIRNQGPKPLYACRVTVSGAGILSLAVEERQTDFALAVNRALARAVRTLFRRQSGRHSL